MSRPSAIQCSDVSRIFCRNYLQSTRYLFKDLFKASSALRQDEFYALQKISFTVYAGEKIGILGGSGSGKTVLAKILGGLICPTGGSVQTSGRAVYVGKVSAGFKSFLSIQENVRLRLAAFGFNHPVDKSLTEKIIAQAGLNAHSRKLLFECSDAEIRHLGYSILMHCGADIFILDGFFPWIKSDDPMAQQLFGHLDQKTVIYVGTAAVVQPWITRALLLEEGRLSYDGTADSAMTAFLSMDGTSRKRASERNFDEDDTDEEEPAAEESAAFSPSTVSGIKIDSADFDYESCCFLANPDKPLNISFLFKAGRDFGRLKNIYLQIHSRFNPVAFARQPLFSPDLNMDIPKGRQIRFNFSWTPPPLHRGVFGLAVDIGNEIHKIGRFGPVHSDGRGEGFSLSIGSTQQVTVDE